MENTVKVKKRDALKPFSIVAGVLMIFLAISIIFSNTATFLVRYYASDDPNTVAAEESVESSEAPAENKKESAVKTSDIINIVLSHLGSMITALLLIAAAVILFVNKNVSGIYIPMGLLTYTAIAPLLNNVSNIIVNYFLAQKLGPNSFWVGDIYVPYIVLAISILISLAIVLVPTVFFFVASCTFLKKVKFIPMFIIFGILVLGTLGSTLLVLLGLISNIINIPYLLDVFMSLYEQGGIALVGVQVYEMYISPLFVGVNGTVMCLAVLFAAIGMCSKPKEIAPKVVYGETSAEPEVSEAFENVSQNNESADGEPEHDFTKGM